MYHCIADLLFILCGFSCFDYDEFKQFYKFSQIQNSQTYSDTFPPTIASVLWFN